MRRLLGLRKPALATQTLTPKLREVVPTMGEEYAVPVATNHSLDDVFFNVQSWLAEEVGEQFALAEAEAFVRGDGSNKPTGMLNDAPASRDDFNSPIRDKDEFQYVDDANSPYSLSYDVLVKCVYKLNQVYRSGASWIFNSNTARELMLLKDQQLRPLWVDGLADGQPSRLLGYPINIVENMDDIDVSGGGDTKFPIGFGQWNRAYLLVDRIGMRVIVDPYTTFGFTRFYFSRRVGGHPLNNDAAKFIKSAA